MEDEEEQQGCPFCKKEDCEHLLVHIDLTFRRAEGGPLSEALNEKWGQITDEGGDDFDEYEPWEELIEMCLDVGDFDETYGLDFGPGAASKYTDVFCSSSERLVDAVRKLKEFWEP